MSDSGMYEVMIMVVDDVCHNGLGETCLSYQGKVSKLGVILYIVVL